MLSGVLETVQFFSIRRKLTWSSGMVRSGQKWLGPFSALIEHESEEQMKKGGLPKRVQVLVLSLMLFSHSVASNPLWPMNCSLSGFLVLHHLLEFAQTHVHWVSDAITISCDKLLWYYPRPLLYHPRLLLPSVLPSIRVFSLNCRYRMWTSGFSNHSFWCERGRKVLRWLDSR